MDVPFLLNGLQNVRRLGSWSLSLDASGNLQIDYDYAPKMVLDPVKNIIVNPNE